MRSALLVLAALCGAAQADEPAACTAWGRRGALLFRTISAGR
jgi:hypothetical protein